MTFGIVVVCCITTHSISDEVINSSQRHLIMLLPFVYNADLSAQSRRWTCLGPRRGPQSSSVVFAYDGRSGSVGRATQVRVLRHEMGTEGVALSACGLMGLEFVTDRALMVR